MKELKSLLSKLYQVLLKKESILPKLLQEPISRKEIDKLIENLDIVISEDVYELFGWKNGIRTSDDYFIGQLWIFPLGGFFPIEDSIERYNYYAGKDGYWSKSMFLLFESGGGEMYLLECDENSPNYGIIFKHSIGAIDYDVIITAYDSLSALIRTVIECYEKDIYFLSTTGVESNFDLELEVAKRNNPNSELWKIF